MGRRGKKSKRGTGFHRSNDDLARTGCLHTIKFKKSAEKDFGKLPSNYQRLIAGRIDTLIEDPHPAGSEKLKGRDDVYRVRQGDWRILYTVDDSERIVTILGIGPRGSIYK